MQHQVFNPRDYPIVMAIDFGTTFSYATRLLPVLFFLSLSLRPIGFFHIIQQRPKTVLRSFARRHLLTCLKAVRIELARPHQPATLRVFRILILAFFLFCRPLPFYNIEDVPMLMLRMTKKSSISPLGKRQQQCQYQQQEAVHSYHYGISDCLFYLCTVTCIASIRLPEQSKLIVDARTLAILSLWLFTTCSNQT